MARSFEFHFEWDAAKAFSNRRKHGVSFDLTVTVFRDPLMISIPDEEHGETEERWITIGQAENSKLLLVVHTYMEISANAANVRIISARPATKHEQRQYEADLMKQEYDFSKGERGKFFRENARLNLPVYLDEEVQNYLQERAKSKGVEVAQLVNEMLRQDIKLIEAVK